MNTRFESAQTTSHNDLKIKFIAGIGICFISAVGKQAGFKLSTVERQHQQGYIKSVFLKKVIPLPSFFLHVHHRILARSLDQSHKILLLWNYDVSNHYSYVWLIIYSGTGSPSAKRERTGERTPCECHLPFGHLCGEFLLDVWFEPLGSWVWRQGQYKWHFLDEVEEWCPAELKWLQNTRQRVTGSRA